jgi:hypothetical protein
VHSGPAAVARLAFLIWLSRMKMCVLLFALLSSLPLAAGTVTVSGDTFFIKASVTPSPTGPQSLFDSETYSQSFVLDVTSAATIPVDPLSGSDFAELAFVLQGAIYSPGFPEPGYIYSEGDASVSAPFQLFEPGNFTSQPTLTCDFPSCSVPFVFNQPEVITITASVQATFYSSDSVTPAGDLDAVFASVEFNGIGQFTDGADAALGGVQYTFTAIPEPATPLLVGAGLLLLGLRTAQRAASLTI